MYEAYIILVFNFISQNSLFLTCTQLQAAFVFVSPVAPAPAVKSPSESTTADFCCF